MTGTPVTLATLLDQGTAPLSADSAAGYAADGSWTDLPLRRLLSDTAAEHPDRTALVGYESDGPRREQTYRELDAAATAAANALYSLGIRPGDAVALMLPNRVEYSALLFACHELRAVYVGIPVSYGAAQTLPILRRSRARAVVIPRGWRSLDHLELVRSLRDQLPALEHVIVVDDSDEGLEAEVLWSSLATDVPHAAGPADPTEICYLGFTSGTTGEPKGAMHTHQSLLHSVRRLAEHIGPETFGERMVQLVASPVGHHTGYVWCTLFTVFMGGTGVLVDRWDPTRGAQLIRDEGITTFFGAPTFLQDLMRTDLASGGGCPLRCAVLAGSSVPRSLPDQASTALDAYIAPAWGMTECSIIVSCTPAEPDAVRQTDGSVFAGSQVRVVDIEDREVPSGTVGDLQVRGPSLFMGYYDRPDATAESFTEDGWFRTGDTASVDEHGWVSLRGRTKDIIIRGGENIPVTDVETLLFDHPDILNAAVIGIPDERLGERACAVLVLAGEADMALDDLNGYLLAAGLSKHYLPERLVVLDELPMTQSGKIQKFRLRDQLHPAG